MKNFIWAFILSFALAGCEPEEPVNTALHWTIEEQCQTWNKWAVIHTDNVFFPVGATLDKIPDEYFGNPPGLSRINDTQVSIYGKCPSDGMIKVYQND